MLDYPRLLARVREVVDDARSHSSFRKQIDSLGVTVHENAGAARFTDTHTVSRLKADYGLRVKKLSFAMFLLGRQLPGTC